MNYVIMCVIFTMQMRACPKDSCRKGLTSFRLMVNLPSFLRVKALLSMC
uniref:Uncharacterized protein n=1 Tax=Rhizophora mucronata TaxID=61149 RepID=A0A2P2JXK5_RHIMU